MALVLNRTLEGSFLSRHFGQRVSAAIPRRMKRLFYVASVLGMLIQNKNPDPRLLLPINEQIKIAYTVPGLLLAVYMYDVIWRHLLSKTIRLENKEIPLTEIKVEEITEKDCWIIGVHFARRASPYLRYGSDSFMAYDIHALLTTMRGLSCAAVPRFNCKGCDVEVCGMQQSTRIVTALKEDVRNKDAHVH